MVDLICGCLSRVYRCLLGTDEYSSNAVGEPIGASMEYELPSVPSGQDLRMLGKIGSRISATETGISGRGTVYGKHRIEQDKLYFEVEVLSPAALYIGLTNTVKQETAAVVLAQSLDESPSASLAGDGDGQGGGGSSGSNASLDILGPAGSSSAQDADAEIIEPVEDDIIDPLELLEGHGCHLPNTDVGDVISCTYDQANYPTFSVYVNSALVESVTGMKGQLLPFVTLLEGGEIIWRFHRPKAKDTNPDFDAFETFMSARSVI
ncbi:unnamed protein product [Amoebophrya sp. A25]|nr:unnamed protein product [Amoebophrya sp. A25]|eukprot:GSA25T00018328001.1